MKTEPTYGTFESILEIATPSLRPVCKSLRAIIASQHPNVVEVVWPKLKIASYGVGPKKNTQHYAYIAVQSAHINLGFYHGVALADPSGILEGTGKALRHVKVRDLPGASGSAIANLLRQALTERLPYE